MSKSPSEPFHNPFGALSVLKGRVPDGPADPEPVASPASADRAVRSISRAVVRIERTGRGGKEVTVVERLTLAPAEREAWLKELKAALGCGGQVEGDALVLQGDQRKRLPPLLTARGVKNVTV
jgi:translation initiation factor 1